MDSDDKDGVSEAPPSSYRFLSKNPVEEPIVKDTELADLESLYREVLPKNIEHTPSAISDNIRGIAEEYVSRVGQKDNVVQMRRPNRMTAAISGLSLAAGLVIGVYISNPDTQGIDSKLLNRGDDIIFMNAKTASSEISNLEDAGPRAWQGRIAELVLEGDMDGAEYLITVFNQRFPEFNHSEFED
jgi:hypothetical protein